MLVPDGTRVSRLYWDGLRKDEWGLRAFPNDYFDSFLDLGANVGFVSLTMRVLFPKARICAIEPCQKTYDALVQNMGHLYIETARLALGNGQPACYTGPMMRSLSNRFRSVDTPDTNAETCPSMTLAGIFDHFDFDPREAFVKIDVEGAEEGIMGDGRAEQLLAQCKMVGFEFHTRGTSTTMGEYNDWVRKRFSDTHDIIINPTRRPEQWSDARLLRK